MDFIPGVGYQKIGARRACRAAPDQSQTPVR